MLSLLKTLALLALTSPAIATIVVESRQVNPEAVFAVDCMLDNNWNTWSPRLLYYSDWQSSVKGTLPDAEAAVSGSTSTTYAAIDWESGTEQYPTQGVFPDTDIFSVWGLVQGVVPGTQVGQAKNNYTTFVCYREADNLLVSYSNGDHCYAAYSCSHEPHNTLATSTLSISPNIANIPKGGTSDPPQAPGVDPVTALHHFYDDLTTNNAGCKGDSYDLGSGYSLQFSSCRFPDTATANAIGVYLTTVVAKSIIDSTAQILPNQCGSFQCAKIGDNAPRCYCDGPVNVPGWSWPTEGDLTLYLAPESDPTQTSIHAELTWTITSPTAAGCDTTACNVIAGLLSAAGAFNPGIGAAGALTGVTCLYCK
jgi:hypothetical protein